MQGLKLFIYLLAGGHSFTFHQAHPHPNSRALSSSSSSLSSTGSFEDALSSLNKQFSSTKAQSTQDFTVPNNIGIGTLAWGDSTRGYGSSYNPGDLNAAYNTLLSNGITFIDTAEVYGYKGINKGESSEQLIGKFMEANFDGARPIIGTKYMPILWTNILVGGGFRFGSKSVFNALQKSCDRLEIAYCDLYQVSERSERALCQKSAKRVPKECQKSAKRVPKECERLIHSCFRRSCIFRFRTWGGGEAW